jgi:hypothetical protein
MDRIRGIEWIDLADGLDQWKALYVPFNILSGFDTMLESCSAAAQLVLSREGLSSAQSVS